jgi:hypothetical protein
MKKKYIFRKFTMKMRHLPWKWVPVLWENSHGYMELCLEVGRSLVKIGLTFNDRGGVSDLFLCQGLSVHILQNILRNLVAKFPPEHGCVKSGHGNLGGNIYMYK